MRGQTPRSGGVEQLGSADSFPHSHFRSTLDRSIVKEAFRQANVGEISVEHAVSHSRNIRITNTDNAAQVFERLDAFDFLAIQRDGVGLVLWDDEVMFLHFFQVNVSAGFSINLKVLFTSSAIHPTTVSWSF